MEVFVIVDLAVDLLLYDLVLVRLNDLVFDSYNAVSVCMTYRMDFEDSKNSSRE